MLEHKVYYSIQEVAHLLGISASLVRCWEKAFGLWPPGKTPAGIRRYTKAEITKLQEIYALVRIKKYTLAGAKLALKEKKSLAQDKEALVAGLHQVQKFLASLQKP